MGMNRTAAIDAAKTALEALDDRHVMKGRSDSLEGKSPVSIVEGFGYEPQTGTRGQANLQPVISIITLVKREDGSGTPIDPAEVEDMLSTLTEATYGALLATKTFIPRPSQPIPDEEIDGAIYRGEQITATVRFDMTRGG